MYCWLHGLNANGFYVAAVGQLGVLETSFVVGTIVKSGYYHDVLQFGTHDEAT